MSRKPVERGGDTRWSRAAQRFKDTIAEVRSILTSLLILLSVTGLAIAVVWEMFRNVLDIEPISVPESLVELGNTPEVVARKLKDDILEINSDDVTLRALGRESRQPSKPQLADGVAAPALDLEERGLPDFDVPGTGLSVNALLHSARHLLGISEMRINGEITRTGQKLQLRLRMVTGATTEGAATITEDDLNALLERGAQEVIRVVAPYTLALYLERRRKTGALDAILHCLRTDPKDDDAKAYNLWGNLLKNQGKYDEAAEKYKTAIDLDPGFLLASVNWGDALGRQGKTKEAIEMFQQVMARDPKFTAGLSQWATLLFTEGSYAEAARKYKEVLDIDPADRSASINLALMLSHQERHEEAITKYQEVIRADPADARAYFGWARTLYDEGKKDEAIMRLEQAIVLDKDFDVAHNNLGYMQLEKGQYEQAIGHFMRAIEISPDMANSYYNWGRALEAVRPDRREAVEKYRKALELAPVGYDFLRDKIAELERGPGSVPREERR